MSIDYAGNQCMYVPRAVRMQVITGRNTWPNPLLVPRAGSGVPVQQLSPHWRNILNVFDGLLETLKAANVPQFLVKKLFQQLFSFVNVQLFNQLLLRRECCSFNNGESSRPL